MDRFGRVSLKNIDQAVEEATPSNTIRTKRSIFKQFEIFCKEKNYELLQTTSQEQIALILKDWAYNMKKTDGSEYKETCVKTMWNITAKMLQEKFYNDFGITIDPFNEIIFKQARDARNAKRRELQAYPSKRKCSAAALSEKELNEMIEIWNENNPIGLQRKFFHLASYELAWRGGEGAKCLIHHFKEETNNDGAKTGSYIYVL
jgi:DNA polymerase III alpha subunit (gram-positive type)